MKNFQKLQLLFNGKIIIVLSLFLLFLGFVNTKSFAQQTATEVESDSVTQNLDELIFLGSRGAPRVKTESPVPVDVLDMKKIATDVAQVNLTEILNYTVPSFSSSPQRITAGVANYIDPISIRGMGTDQTLLLINGKRRHTVSIVNTGGSLGRGSVSTDLNAIPSIAIDKMEILRDGASAQYGSDAVAGVINIGLKRNSKGTKILITTGANASNYEVFTLSGANVRDFNSDINGNLTNSKSVFDGQIIQASINQGLSLGKKGFVNLSLALDLRQSAVRTGEYTDSINNKQVTGLNSNDEYLQATGTTRENYKSQVGQANVKGVQFFLNSEYTLNQQTNTAIYLFGGFSYKKGNTASYFTLPFDVKNIRGIYPNGYLPTTDNHIYDVSVAFGLKGDLGTWHYDISNTLGRNYISNYSLSTVNVSTATPENYLHKGNLPEGLDSNKTGFYNGASSFLQNTTNFDVFRKIDFLNSLNIAAGLEYRYENYVILEGELASWANYNSRSQGQTLTDPINIYYPNVLPSTLANGKIAPPPSLGE